MKTDISIILDRSGSMAACMQATIAGYNKFLRGQKEEKSTDAQLSLYQFDNVYETVHECVPIVNAWELNALVYQPRGSTALYDAIVRTIDDTGKRLAAMPISQRPDQVVVVIITDGFENASKHGAEDVRKRIKLQTETYNWLFVFLGANQDAILGARELEIRTSGAANYVATPSGTGAMYGALHTNMRRLRSSGVTGQEVGTFTFFNGETHITSIDGNDPDATAGASTTN